MINVFIETCEVVWQKCTIINITLKNVGRYCFYRTISLNQLTGKMQKPLRPRHATASRDSLLSQSTHAHTLTAGV